MLIGYFLSVYISGLYPAWMIPFGYFYLGIVIWQLFENKKLYSIRDIIILSIIVVGVTSSLIIPKLLSSKDIIELTSKTVYPGARISVGGEGWEYLFNYIVSIYLPFTFFTNPCEFSQFLCFFPIPVILGIRCFLKNKNEKKKDFLLLILIIVPVLLVIWNFVKIPEVISKITLLSLSTSKRSQIVVGFSFNVLLIYVLGNYEAEKSNKLYKIVISFLVAFFGVYVVSIHHPEFVSKFHFISICLFTFVCYYIMNCNKKNNEFIAVLLILMSIGAGIMVHPLVKGLDVIYEKPISKKIQSIVKENPDAIWLNVNAPFVVGNYAAANGARILSTTNYYPNYDLWDVLDSKKNYAEIWNRYAHLAITLNNDSPSVLLNGQDYYTIIMNTNNLCELNVDYLLTSDAGLGSLSSDKVSINNIYSNDNMFIFAVDCY